MSWRGTSTFRCFGEYRYHDESGESEEGVLEESEGSGFPALCRKTLVGSEHVGSVWPSLGAGREGVKFVVHET